MTIIVENQQEENLIKSLCHVALRADGIQNLEGVNKILAAVVYPATGIPSGTDTSGNQPAK